MQHPASSCPPLTILFFLIMLRSSCHHLAVASKQRRRRPSSCVRHLGVSAPSSPTTSWERGAKLVKNTDTTNQYLEHIRAEHDPALHLKTIEDELRGTMGKALGRQGEKIMLALRCMEQTKREYDDLIESDNDTSRQQQLKDCVEKYNEYREQAKTARWELLVHRQAVGFIVNNHKYVHQHFPIPDALSLDEDGDNNVNDQKVNDKVVTKEFGDQLDWWQRIGRWR